MADIPRPLITCLLPDYEDKHCQWLIWQYLESSGFTHTLSAFSLELNLRGIKSEQFTHIDEVRALAIAFTAGAMNAFVRAGSPLTSQCAGRFAPALQLSADKEVGGTFRGCASSQWLFVAIAPW